MKTFSQHKPSAHSPSVQKAIDRRNALMARARQGSTVAARKLQAEYGLRVYTPQEIRQFEQDRPDVTTREVIGNSTFNTLPVNG